MTTQTRRLTYEEYINGPEIMARYDIVDGEMIMAPSPTRQHQRILWKLGRALDTFVVEHQLGEILPAPLDVIVSQEPLRARQPDLLFISNERANIAKDVIEGGPDVVVEILSPSNTRGEIESKLADYASIGVKECWLVSPEARTVEVLVLEDGQWSRHSLRGVGDGVESLVFEGLELEVSQLFV